MIAILFAVVVLQQLLDGYTTWKTIWLGGYEKNKAVLWLMNLMGVIPALVVLKGGLAAIVGAVLWFYGSAWLEMTLMLAGVIAVYTWIMVNNFRELAKQQAKVGQ